MATRATAEPTARRPAGLRLAAAAQVTEAAGLCVAAVFGAARRWYQTPDRIPAEEMAARIETMVKPVFLSSFK